MLVLYFIFGVLTFHVEPCLCSSIGSRGTNKIADVSARGGRRGCMCRAISHMTTPIFRVVIGHRQLGVMDGKKRWEGRKINFANKKSKTILIGKRPTTPLLQISRVLDLIKIKCRKN